MPRTHSAIAIVVGTSRTIQISGLDLKPFLEYLCLKFNVCAVAEELSAEALAESNCTESMPMKVAIALQLSHRFCDPNKTERTRLGIRQENDIRIGAFPSTLPESEIAARIAESHAKRERYWLEQLRSLDLWPILFVCRADHVASFCYLLRQNSIVAHVAAEDWI